MKIVVDAFGGDNAPEEIVKGALNSLELYNDVNIVLTGDDNVLANLIADSKYKNHIEILHAPEIITNEDVPNAAIRGKKNSSLVVALEHTKNDDEAVGMVSAGSTGSVLMGAVLKLGRIKGVSRPALCPVLPTLSGSNLFFIDCGANVDCRPEMLVQFAYMGVAYCKVTTGKDNPTVALLSNGTEDKKGNELTKQAFELLKAQKGINFVGNMEARELLSGKYDVVVADGFYGNIALKSYEGASSTLLKMIKQEIKSSPIRMFGAAFLKSAFKDIRYRMDYNSAGGALFVGCSKILMKCHGAAVASSICGAIGQIRSIAEGDLVRKIQVAIEENPISTNEDKESDK